MYLIFFRYRYMLTSLNTLFYYIPCHYGSPSWWRGWNTDLDTCINDLVILDERSGEESKEQNSWNVNTPLAHRRDPGTAALVPMTPRAREMPWFSEYWSECDRDRSSSFDKKFRHRFSLPNFLTSWKLKEMITLTGGWCVKLIVSERKLPPLNLSYLEHCRGWTFLWH